MKKIFPPIVCAFLAVLAAWPAVARAASPVLAGRYHGWKVYSFHDKSGPVCFMSAQPEKEQGHYTQRGQVFFFVTHWPSGGGKNVVSISTGYTFKKGSRVTLDVKGKTFNLFTQGTMAWTQDGAEDNAVVKEIKAGEKMVVKGTSNHGTLTTDTYSLKGSSAAYRAMMRTCSGHTTRRHRKK